MTNRNVKLIAIALAIVFPLTALPLLAVAQAAGAASGPAPATDANAQPQRQGRWMRMSPEKAEKRMRLARTLGLAEALDLEPAQALKLGETIGKFDEKRAVLRKQQREAREVLRRAAQGEKVTTAEVDGAIQKTLEARAQLAGIDRETVAAVTHGLTPDKKARAVLFLSKFQRHFPGPGMGMGPGPGGPRGGPGMGPGRGMGPRGQQGLGPGPGGGPGGGWGMGPGGDDPEMMGMGPMLDDEED